MSDIAEQSIALRPVHESDLDALFRQTSDPESVRMAAFLDVDRIRPLYARAASDNAGSLRPVPRTSRNPLEPRRPDEREGRKAALPPPPRPSHDRHYATTKLPGGKVAFTRRP